MNCKHPLSIVKKKSIGIEELNQVLQYGDISNVNIVLDFSLARGLDYYTGCIFEAIILDSGIGSVSGGGRYDDLTGVFGLKNVSGVGISFGLDRIYDILASQGFYDEKYTHNTLLFCHFDAVARKYALACAHELRAKQIPTVVYPDLKKINKQFDYANKCGYKWVAVVGDNEIETESVQLKNMQTGEQQKLSVTDLISKFS